MNYADIDPAILDTPLARFADPAVAAADASATSGGDGGIATATATTAPPATLKGTAVKVKVSAAKKKAEDVAQTLAVREGRVQTLAGKKSGVVKNNAQHLGVQTTDVRAHTQSPTSRSRPAAVKAAARADSNRPPAQVAHRHGGSLTKHGHPHPTARRAENGHRRGEPIVKPAVPLHPHHVKKRAAHRSGQQTSSEQANSTAATDHHHSEFPATSGDPVTPAAKDRTRRDRDLPGVSYTDRDSYVVVTSNAKVTVVGKAALSAGGGDIQVDLDRRTGELSVKGRGFTFSDSTLFGDLSKFAGSGKSAYGAYAGASGSLPLNAPHRANFSLDAGVSRTVNVGQASFSYSAGIAAHPTSFNSLAYVEELSITVKLPHGAGELSYSLTIEIQPLPRSPTPRPGDGRPVIVGGAVAAVVVLAYQAANVYIPGNISGTRLPSLAREGANR